MLTGADQVDVAVGGVQRPGAVVPERGFGVGSGRHGSTAMKRSLLDVPRVLLVAAAVADEVPPGWAQRPLANVASAAWQGL